MFYHLKRVGFISTLLFLFFYFFKKEKKGGIGVFNSPHFTFDGRSSKEFQLKIVRIGAKDKTSFGWNRTLETEMNHTLVPTLKGIQNATLTYTITLIKKDAINPLPITEDEKFEIIRWLFQDEFKPFISDDNKDLIYYVMFTKGAGFQNGLNEGYFELELQFNAPFAFTPITTHSLVVRNRLETKLTYRSNVQSYLEPDIEFQLSPNSTWIEIQNETTGDVVRFENLPPNSRIYIYNEGIKQAVMVDNPTYNLRPHFNGKWLRLAYGVNHLVIQSPEVMVNIMGQSKIAIT